MRRPSAALAAGLPSLVAAASVAGAQADLELVEVRVDPPTLHTVGIQVLISGDDDRDASISVRVRRAGDDGWRPGPPLFRVLPETVSEAVPAQFAGSLFDLSPGARYQVELHAVDPDGLDETRTVEATTRPVPAAEPAHPRAVAVGDADELRQALGAAAPGDVITLADGTYAGPFSIDASGTAEDPIVVRGGPGAVLDGGGCDGCNVLEVYGSYVQIEGIGLEHATRALRFLGVGAAGNVARRLRIRDVVHGIGSNSDQTAFTICDNRIEGRLAWPWTFADDATSHWDDRGVDMNGTGHVVCHNLIRGFGDPVVNKHRLVRAWDVYGNDIYDAFDGTELDEGEGNVRMFGNRYTNVMAPISIQPVFGGPAYVLRNVLYNVPDEQIKLKSLGGTEEPSGALIYHNTFVSPELALNLQTPITQHNFVVANNLFVGPEALAGSRTVDWTAAIDGGRFDHNGYYPDGGFWFGVVDGENRIYDSFAAVLAAGQVEQSGVLLARPIFADDVVGPDGDGTEAGEPPDFELAAGSDAIDRGEVIPGFNDRFVGDGPDLGARERGCPEPVYGPRPPGMEEVTNEVNCAADGGGLDPEADAGPGDGDGEPGDGGCGCRAARDGTFSASLLVLIALALAPAVRRRRDRRGLMVAVAVALAWACSSSGGPSGGQIADDGPSARGGQPARVPSREGHTMKPWIRPADPAERPDAVGLWRVPAGTRERAPTPSVRSYPGTVRFLYDGQTVTMHLFSEKEWMYRTADDHYRLASRWQGDVLQVRPPFGLWTDLARFRDGRFETTREDPPWRFEPVPSRDACEPDDLPLLADRAAHDYSIEPTDPSPM